MDLYVGAGQRTTVRMNQREEHRRRRALIGSVVAPALLVGGWQIAVHTWFAEETPAVSTLELGAAVAAPQVFPQSDAELYPAPAASVMGAAVSTERGGTIPLSAAQAIAVTSPSQGENGGPGTARPSSAVVTATTAGSEVPSTTAHQGSSSATDGLTQAAGTTQAGQTSVPGHTHATGTTTTPPTQSGSSPGHTHAAPTSQPTQPTSSSSQAPVPSSSSASSSPPSDPPSSSPSSSEPAPPSVPESPSAAPAAESTPTPAEASAGD
ncbi:MAG: hypothetical protein JNL54_19770 [Kineosporiaceae bacterium]|nr:hypothetical protein [Kineosporiaceae bacterium]